MTFAVLATVDTAPATRTFMTVTSKRPGSPIYVNDRQVGVTPARLALPVTHDHEISVGGPGGVHTCRVDPTEGWVVHGVVHAHTWLRELVSGEDTSETWG